MAKINDKVLKAKKSMISQYKKRNKMTRVKNREKIREIWNKLDDNEKDILHRELKRGTEGLEISVKFAATIISMFLSVVALIFSLYNWLGIKIDENDQVGVFIVGGILFSNIFLIAMYYLSGYVSMNMKMESEYILDMIGEE